jgi:hypothetical protein
MTAIGLLLSSAGALLIIACHRALARRLDTHRRIQRRLHASSQSAKPTIKNATANPPHEYQHAHR